MRGGAPAELNDGRLRAGTFRAGAFSDGLSGFGPEDVVFQLDGIPHFKQEPSAAEVREERIAGLSGIPSGENVFRVPDGSGVIARQPAACRIVRAGQMSFRTSRGLFRIRSPRPLYHPSRYRARYSALTQRSSALSGRTSRVVHRAISRKPPVSSSRARRESSVKSENILPPPSLSVSPYLKEA